MRMFAESMVRELLWPAFVIRFLRQTRQLGSFQILCRSPHSQLDWGNFSERDGLWEGSENRFKSVTSPWIRLVDGNFENEEKRDLLINSSSHDFFFRRLVIFKTRNHTHTYAVTSEYKHIVTHTLSLSHTHREKQYLALNFTQSIELSNTRLRNYFVFSRHASSHSSSVVVILN